MTTADLLAGVNAHATGDERIHLAAAFRSLAEAVDRERVWRATSSKTHEAKALGDVAALAMAASYMMGG